MSDFNDIAIHPKFIENNNEFIKIESNSTDYTCNEEKEKENNSLPLNTRVISQPNHRNKDKVNPIVRTQKKSSLNNDVKFNDQTDCQIYDGVKNLRASTIDSVPHSQDNTVVPIFKSLDNNNFKLSEEEGELKLFKKPDQFVAILRAIYVNILLFIIVAAILGNVLFASLGLASFIIIFSSSYKQSMRVFSRTDANEKQQIRLTQDEEGIKMQMNVRINSKKFHLKVTNVQHCLIRNVKNIHFNQDSDVINDEQNEMNQDLRNEGLQFGIDFGSQIQQDEGMDIVLLVDAKDNYYGVLEQDPSNQFVYDYIKAQIEKFGKTD